MNRHWELAVRPIVEAAEPRVLVEVGSRGGDLTARLLAYGAERDAVVHVIDPAPAFDVAAWEEKHGDRLVFHRRLSLEALPELPVPDAVFIDGDHNWYTVYHELKAVEARAREERSPFPLVFFHDIHWPYGRRDLYYDPSTIPEEHRHEHARRGILPGRRELVERGGVNSHLDNAVTEDGARNGVLTAVEDFLAEATEPLELRQVTGLHGLGVLVPTSALDGNDGLRESVERLAQSDFLAEQCRLIESHRLDEIVRRTRHADAEKALRSTVAASLRDLTAAQQQLTTLRTHPLWRWAYRVARLVYRVIPGLTAKADPTEGVANRLRRASERLERWEDPAVPAAAPPSDPDAAPGEPAGAVAQEAPVR